MTRPWAPHTLTSRQRAQLQAQLARLPTGSAWLFVRAQARQHLGGRCGCAACQRWQLGAGEDPSWLLWNVDQTMIELNKVLALASAPADYVASRMMEAHRALVKASSEAAEAGFDTIAVGIDRLSAGVAKGLENLSSGVKGGLINVSDGAGHAVRQAGAAVNDVGWGGPYTLLLVGVGGVLLVGGGVLALGLSGGVQTALPTLASNAPALLKAAKPF